MTVRSLQKMTIAMGALALASCATGSSRRYQNRDMDFGSIKTVAILPFWNLSHDNLAADRVRDVLSNGLLATQAVYVLPTGEVARGVSRLGLSSAVAPSAEDVVKLGTLLKIDAVIAGVVREYGEVRSSNASANVVSISAQMFETATGKVVWSSSCTRGGVGLGSRLLGLTGGEPMDAVTEQAVDDLINSMFK